MKDQKQNVATYFITSCDKCPKHIILNKFSMILANTDKYDQYSICEVNHNVIHEHFNDNGLDKKYPIPDDCPLLKNKYMSTT